MTRAANTGPGVLDASPFGIAVTCSDCGRESAAACPWHAVSCSECSFFRERSVAGVSDDIPSCPAHGAYLDDPEPRS